MQLPMSGMAQMLESMIPADVKEAIDKAKTEIPEFANSIKCKIDRIEKTQAEIMTLLNEVISWQQKQQ
jgi:hypothetical protein